MLTFKDNKGQGLLEYMLILILVAIVVLIIVAVLGPTIVKWMEANGYGHLIKILGGE